MTTQTEIPGTEHPSGDKDLDALCLAFKRASKRRKAAQDAEIDARDVLTDAMKRKKLTTYENKTVKPPLLVVVTSTEKVKVEEIDEKATFDDEDDDGGGAKYAEMAEQKATKKKPVLSEA